MSDTTSAPAGTYTPAPAVENLTSDQIAAEIAASMSGRANPGYLDAGHPEHAAAVARVSALHARQHGEAAGDGDAAPDALPTPLTAEEADTKVHNHLALANVSSEDAAELREGLTHAAQELALDHAGLGAVVMRLNDALRTGISTTAEQAEEHLRREWGEHYAANMRAAEIALNHLERTRPGARAFMVRSGLGNDPTTISVLARAGQRLSASRYGRR